MLLGLGSVGNYLLSYLMQDASPELEIIAAGRDRDKLEKDVNIARVAALIRQTNTARVSVEAGVDLESPECVAECIARRQPDIIVNTSRVYAGLKYGSISWKALRAYGVWAPLAVRYIRNIMLAADMAESSAIVINTSYSDAVIPWLRSADAPYPDLGSGNLNHLVPRLRFGIAEELRVNDYWNVEVWLAASHFHDVVLSKEGHDAGVAPLLYAEYRGERVEPNLERLFRACALPMPVDAKRNMMNASSNYEIIRALIASVQSGRASRLHCPGALGEIGGYPVAVAADGGALSLKIDESRFSLEKMRRVNRASIALDGVEDVRGGSLVYTDALISKVKDAFKLELPKSVPYSDIDGAAELLINGIIKKAEGER